jgi:pimeloyl-ACP methyl ester carboxylesterase
MDADDADLVVLPDGRRLQLWRGGSATGPVVLFLPGCPDSRLAARPGDQAARRAGVRLVAVNRPGYGRSDPHESGHTSVADDLVAVADTLGVDGFAVLGMSVGGPYALACAARHPGRVRSVGVVAGPAVVPELDPPWHRDDLAPDQRMFFTRLLSGSVADAVAVIRPDFEAYVERLAPQDPDDAGLVRRLVQGLHPQDAAVLARQPVVEVATTVREALAQLDGYLRDAAVTFRAWEVPPEQVRCPCWLWYGAADPQVSVRNGVWLAGRVPTATLVVREGAGHLAALHDHWDEILVTLRDAAVAG